MTNDAMDQKPKEDEGKHITEEIFRRLQKSDPEIEIIFQQLKSGDNKISVDVLFKKLKQAGLLVERDQRLQEIYQKCCKISDCFKDVKFAYEEFHRLIESRKSLISKCITSRLMIEDFQEFSCTIDTLYECHQTNISGQLSNEFPTLSRVNINQWGVAVCSVDGQRKFIGDSSNRFTMEGLCKPLLLGLVLKTIGFYTLKKYIAFEPTDQGKDITELNSQGKPFNAMVNTGSVMLCALLIAIAYKDKSISFIHEAYIRFLKDLTAGEYIDFNAPSYISKKESCDELRCLSYGLIDSPVLPSEVNVEDSLDLFLKASSVETTAEGLSNIAATLANGGVNPLTEEKVLSTSDVKEILSAMYSFGLYKFSGENSFTIGLPMKSSASGGLILVVPEKMGIALYSPLLDENMISERSYQFCKGFVEKLKLHQFDSVDYKSLSRLPSRKEVATICEPYCELLTAAAANDVTALSRLKEQKADFYATDFYGHTVLHVAVANGALDAIKFILNIYPSLANNKDKLNRTAQMYAIELQYHEITSYLERFIK